MYRIIEKNFDDGIFKYRVNDIDLTIDYPFYKQDKNSNSLNLNFLKVSATDKNHLVKLYNVNGTNLLRFELAVLEISPSELVDVSKAFLDMQDVIDCFQEIISHNFPFDFTKEQEEEDV